MENSQRALGWAAKDADGVLSPIKLSLRAKNDDDIIFKILYCGVCHTDLSTIKNEWGTARYPIVPGHEIIGVVIEVGTAVQNFKIGDSIGVGYIANSCLTCDQCKQNFENYCPNLIPSFNSPFHNGIESTGGFCNLFIVKEHFAIKIPENMPLEKIIAPLMCAGITVYSPMKYFGLNEKGKHLGVIGLGGLGHVAVKFAKAFGMRVTVVESNPEKRKEAMDVLGADSFLVSNCLEEMEAADGTIDGIIDTVPTVHDLHPIISLLKVHGKLIVLGGPSKPDELLTLSLIKAGKMIAGSCIGGIKDTQEMINFAAKHNITAEVEVIGIDYANKAMERLSKGDVRYRFVIDIVNSL
ncbi:probable mannitol dehydrogenase [Asparagus officinalis]|uniref:probable mannitol dehydrogenase n=1 Tax=Asparagus officinalis TaxID=4686 RepID=UPI00098DE61B|nr:probable mannitol dehydrogenase [Asparagus officinalis]